MLDVMFIDELGYLSAELLNVMDTVLRSVRGKSAFMGGVLIISSMDPQQLQPIRAKPVLLSSLLLTSFAMILMEHSVRARTDSLLQQLISISREECPTLENVTEFRDIIINGCNHVTSWNDPTITRDMIRIVGTKRAMTKAEDE